MAWREWFDLHQPKWLPKIIATACFTIHGGSIAWQFPGFQTLSIQTFQTIADYIRLLLLALHVIYHLPGNP